MRQPYEISMALRYLRIRGRNGFISFISLVSMVGIGLAVAVLIVVLSVMNGFEHELRQRILNVVSHATISGAEAPLADWRAMREDVLMSPEVIGAAPYVDGQGLLMAGESLRGVQVRGIDPALSPTFRSLQGCFGRAAWRSWSRAPSGHSSALRLRELGVGVRRFRGADPGPGHGHARGRDAAHEAAAVADCCGSRPAVSIYDRGLIYVNLDDAALLYRTGGEAHRAQACGRDISARAVCRGPTGPGAGRRVLHQRLEPPARQFLPLHSAHQDDHVRHIFTGDRRGGIQHPLTRSSWWCATSARISPSCRVSAPPRAASPPCSQPRAR